MIPVSMTVNDFNVTGLLLTIDALDVLCAQLTRDLFALAKFLFFQVFSMRSMRRQ